MRYSTERILTTHAGSLARPTALLDLMRARAGGETVADEALAEAQRQAVAEVVAKQQSAGLDILSDGEQSKAGFFAYIGERLAGFEPRPQRSGIGAYQAEIDAFPEYYEHYMNTAMLGGMAVPTSPLGCVGPVNYIGHEQLHRDLEHLRAALGDTRPGEAFVSAVAPSGVGGNEYYPTEAEYLAAVADALDVEYAAIIEAGFDLQIDDPFLTDVFSYSTTPPAETVDTAERYVAAINRSLAGIPPQRIRFHTCYGINEGPRVHDAPLAATIQTLLQINAGAFSFEAANPRHEHAYHVFDTVELPDGVVIIPGVISHATNIVEHPDTIADRILRFAERVGRDRVLAGADCGFSSQATYTPEIHPDIVWAKFEALAEGARRATTHLW
jgi:5-methyltetrahydropteroyltriglutamate--homocysteine methyltransferase